MAGCDDVNVLLIGKSGAGKSTLGNLLIQNEKFKVVCGFTSDGGEEAADSEGEYLVNINGHRFTMHVFDMPGLAEADREDSENLEEIIKCIRLIAESREPVIHVMIYVLSAAGRFTKDDANIVRYFADEGRNFWSRVMLVITNGQKYGETDEERHACLDRSLENPRCSEDLRKLIRNIDRRRVVFTESKDNNDKIQAKRKELYQIIQELSCANDEGCIYNVLVNAKRSLTRSQALQNPAIADEEIRENVRREIKEVKNYMFMIMNLVNFCHLFHSQKKVCFPRDSTVITKDGIKFMYEINPGDEVLAITPHGSTIFSEVVTFLHYEPKTFATYMNIQTMSGTLLHISDNHLVFSVTPDVVTFKSRGSHG